MIKKTTIHTLRVATLAVITTLLASCVCLLVFSNWLDDHEA